MNKILVYTVIGVTLGFLLSSYAIAAVMICTGIIVHYIEKLMKKMKRLDERLDEMQSLSQWENDLSETEDGVDIKEENALPKTAPDTAQ